MSSIPENPNPNPNPPEKSPVQVTSKNNRKSNKKKKKKNRRSRSKNKGKPNWLELPEDVWFAILSKLKTIDIIEHAQKVCMLFRKLCKHPSMFITIDMYLPDAYHCLPYDVNRMTRYAVDRSAGQLVDIYLEYLCDDETLLYIAERSPNLKRLRLAHYIYVGDEGLIEAVQKLPMLEEVQLIICSFSEETVEALGRALPRLTSFSLTGVGSKDRNFVGNEKALAIAKSMPGLRHLQLIGNHMNNAGLQAILDGCPLLESLDLRTCFHVDLLGELGKRCRALKRLRLPYDSTKDYGLRACEEEDDFFGGGSDSDFDGYSYLGFGGFEDLEFEDSDYFFDDDDDLALDYYFGLGGILDDDSSD